MNRKRHRKEHRPQIPAMDAKLRNGLHKLSQRDSMFFGFALARLRACREQTIAEQAAILNISEDALAAWRCAGRRDPTIATQTWQLWPAGQASVSRPWTRYCTMPQA
jgi:hypothetical protein